MEKKLRLSVKGAIRFLAVFAVLLWMWQFFRSYLFFLILLLMITCAILSAAALWVARDGIRAEIGLPYRRVGKNTDVLCEIRFFNPLRFAGFSIDVTYQYGNLFTGSMEEKKEKLWAAPRKGGSLQFLLNSRYAGGIRVSVETYRVYDLLHLFYLSYQEDRESQVMVWCSFTDGEDAIERYEHMEGFPREDESKKRGTEYHPDYEIREYIAGDELKNIHWKLSAKQGKMMVRERLAAGREKVNVLLPLGEDPGENDARMEFLYGLCRLLLARDHPIQLFWQDAGFSLCSRYLVELGDLENALGEILSANGIRKGACIEEQMAIEHPAQQYLSCRQGSGQVRGRSLDKTDVSLVKTNNNGRYDWLAVLAKAFILAALVYGAIGGFLAAYEIKFHASFCVFVVSLLAFLLSAVYETGKRWLTNLVSLLVFFLYLGIALKNYWEINSGYYYILNRIFEVARDYFDVSAGMEYSLAVEDAYLAVTTFAIFLGMVGIILMNIQLQNRSTPLGVMFLTLTPYVMPLYFDCSPPLSYVLLLLIGYAMVLMLSYGRGRVSAQMRYLLPVALAAVLLVRAAAFLLPEIRYARIVPRSAAKEASEQGMELFAQYGMSAMFPRDMAGSGIGGGRLSRGSAVMPSYETALTVRYTPYSYDPVYLKAYTGLDYIGTAWTQADSEWPGDADMEMSLYVRQRRFEEVGGDAVQGFGVMEVERAKAEDSYEYRPYYTDYCNIEKRGNTLVYSYYPDNDDPVSVFGKAPYERYLDVPESCEAAVSRVCDEAGFGGSEQEIAAQIVNYFEENYKYTLRPGFYYGNPDYISHFLLESKKGYCAHFASAAAMLFRQMGIPARYVEGYAFSYAEVAEKGELVEGADYDDYYRGFSEIGRTALIQIEIPEAYAHAWVEIYDHERGWLVVDPTPSSTEEETTSFWDIFMQGEDGETERALGEDVLGGYLESALSALLYAAIVVVIVAAIVFMAVWAVRKERERRLPGRERVKLVYGRLQKAAAKKDKRFLAQRTLKEQIAWMRENCRVEINEEQEKALYQVFFGRTVDYDCDKLCVELQNCRAR